MSDLRLYNTVFDCVDAVSQARFWAAALGWELRRTDPGWSTIGNPRTPGQYLGFAPVPERKSVKNRLHLDLLPAEGTARDVERRRLEALGARLIETIYEDDKVAHDVMADPEGNEFCLLEPYPEYFG